MINYLLLVSIDENYLLEYLLNDLFAVFDEETVLRLARNLTT